MTTVIENKLNVCESRWPRRTVYCSLNIANGKQYATLIKVRARTGQEMKVNVMTKKIMKCGMDIDYYQNEQ